MEIGKIPLITVGKREGYACRTGARREASGEKAFVGKKRPFVVVIRPYLYLICKGRNGILTLHQKPTKQEES